MSAHVANRIRRQLGFIMIGLGDRSSSKGEVYEAVSELAQIAQDIETGDAFVEEQADTAEAAQ